MDDEDRDRQIALKVLQEIDALRPEWMPKAPIIEFAPDSGGDPMMRIIFEMSDADLEVDLEVDERRAKEYGRFRSELFERINTEKPTHWPFIWLAASPELVTDDAA